MSGTPQFDSYAETYDDDLNRALWLTGENKDYFAQQRVKWLARCLERLEETPGSILDYGCGVGDTAALLRSAFDSHSVLGLDVSERSLQIAKTRNQTKGCDFKGFAEHSPDGDMDLAYCNGVFHHIPLAVREAAVQYVYRCLRPGGLFAFWENNKWNPGTRYIMSRVPFDRDAVTLTAPDSRRLLSEGGFKVLSTYYCFFFPRILRLVRFIEPWIAGVPLGAQYLILARKPL
jgi:SAM-dependent methyltransferase